MLKRHVHIVTITSEPVSKQPFSKVSAYPILKQIAGHIIYLAGYKLENRASRELSTNVWWHPPVSALSADPAVGTQPKYFFEDWMRSLRTTSRDEAELKGNSASNKHSSGAVWVNPSTFCAQLPCTSCSINPIRARWLQRFIKCSIQRAAQHGSFEHAGLSVESSSVNSRSMV